eukprot:1815094-Amphidinium_carterae.1
MLWVVNILFAASLANSRLHSIKRSEAKPSLTDHHRHHHHHQNSWRKCYQIIAANCLENSWLRAFVATACPPCLARLESISEGQYVALHHGTLESLPVAMGKVKRQPNREVLQSP